MSADELWARKLKFLSDAERDMRRKLNRSERILLQAIFDKIILQLTTEGGNVAATRENMRVLDSLGKVFADFASDQLTKITAQYAVTALQNVKLSEAYFAAEGAQGQKFEAIARTADKFIRDMLGIKANGQLKPGGFLQEIIADTTVRSQVRMEMMRAINEGGDLRSIRNRVRQYLVPEKVGEAQPTGPIERQFEKFAFDTLQKADRATNEAYAVALDLASAIWTGGLIDTSRCLCQKLNALAWTREELEAIDKTDWDGKDGSIFISAGGHRCRHIPRWIGIAATVRKRKDLEIVDGKLSHRIGVEPQPFNKCIPRKKVKR